jgi:hypothetical protein
MIEQVTVPKVGVSEFAVPVKAVIGTVPLRALQRNPAECGADFGERTSMMPVLLKELPAHLLPCLKHE